MHTYYFSVSVGQEARQSPAGSPASWSLTAAIEARLRKPWVGVSGALSEGADHSQATSPCWVFCIMAKSLPKCALTCWLRTECPPSPFHLLQYLCLFIWFLFFYLVGSSSRLGLGWGKQGTKGTHLRGAHSLVPTLHWCNLRVSSSFHLLPRVPCRPHASPSLIIFICLPYHLLLSNVFFSVCFLKITSQWDYIKSLLCIS